MYLQNEVEEIHTPLPDVAAFLPDVINNKECRYVGKRYLENTRRSGGMGAISAFPLEVPISIYVCSPNVRAR